MSAADMTQQTPTSPQSAQAFGISRATFVQSLSFPNARGGLWKSASPSEAEDGDGRQAAGHVSVCSRKTVSWFSHVSDEQIRESVAKNTTFHDVLVDLGFIPQPQSFNKELVRFKSDIRKHLIRRLQAMQVAYGHLRNREYNEESKKQHAAGLSDDGPASKRAKDIHSRVLRQIVQDDGRPYMCEWCHCTHYTWDKHRRTWTWLGRPFTLEVHHIQGRQIERPHDAGNLNVLCPQCHATTENYSGRSKRGPENDAGSAKKRTVS